MSHLDANSIENPCERSYVGLGYEPDEWRHLPLLLGILGDRSGVTTGETVILRAVSSVG